MIQFADDDDGGGDDDDDLSRSGHLACKREIWKHSQKHGGMLQSVWDTGGMRVHLWHHHHAKHCNRGSLYRQYLTPLQLNTKTCSICSKHSTAAHECPVILELAALCVILRHGHHERGGRAEGDGLEYGSMDGGRSDRSEKLQEAKIHHVEHGSNSKRKARGKTRKPPRAAATASSTSLDAAFHFRRGKTNCVSALIWR